MKNEPATAVDRAAPGRREGFSLVEVVVSMVIMAVVVTSLAGLSAKTAQNSLVIANSTARNAFALQETNRLAAVPYASLTASGMTGCDTLTTGNLKYNRCVSVVSSTRYRTVTIIVNPVRTGPGIWSDTIVFRRAIEFVQNPLFTP